MIKSRLRIKVNGPPTSMFQPQPVRKMWLHKGHQYAETATKKKLVIDRIRKQDKENYTSKIFDWDEKLWKYMTLLKIYKKTWQEKNCRNTFWQEKLIISRRKKSAAPGLSNAFFPLFVQQTHRECYVYHQEVKWKMSFWAHFLSFYANFVQR